MASLESLVCLMLMCVEDGEPCRRSGNIADLSSGLDQAVQPTAVCPPLMYDCLLEEAYNTRQCLYFLTFIIL